MPAGPPPTTTHVARSVVIAHSSRPPYGGPAGTSTARRTACGTTGDSPRRRGHDPGTGWVTCPAARPGAARPHGATRTPAARRSPRGRATGLPITSASQSASRSAPPCSASMVPPSGQVRGEDAGRRTRQEVLVDDRLGVQHAGPDERGDRPLAPARPLLRRRPSGGDVGVDAVGEEAEAGEAQVALGGGQPLAPHLRRHLGAAAAGSSARRRSTSATSSSKRSRPARGERDAPRLDLTEPDPQRPLRERPVGVPEGARLGERAERGLPQQHVRAVPPRRALDLVDHLDAAGLHGRVQVVDVEHPRREVVEVGRRHPADVGRDPGDALELGVPGPVDRVGGQREGRGGQLEVPVRVRRRAAPRARSATSARASSSAGNSSRAARKRCSRSSRSGSKNRRSSGTSIEVNTRNGFAASSSRSTGRKAVETTGTGAGAASRRS